MTRNEILMELNELVDPDGFDFDRTQFVVIGKAASILNGKDDSTVENIEIWVHPKYYDFIASNDEYIEIKDEDGNRTIPFAFMHYEKKYGEIRLYNGDIIGSRPKSKQIYGFNVKVPIQERATACILNFHRKNDNSMEVLGDE